MVTLTQPAAERPKMPAMQTHSSGTAREWAGGPEPTAARTARRCPFCGAQTIRRSRRRGVIERYLMPAIRMRPYRCEDCDYRFYSTSSS